MKKLLIFSHLCLFGLWLVSSAQAATYQANKDYLIIDAGQKIQLGSQPEVIEFFYYGCQHCNNIMPYVKKWLKNKPNHVTYSRVPAFFSKRWEWSAYLYSVAESLGVADEMHDKVFAKHFRGGGIKSRTDIYELFSTVGITKEQVNEAYDNSFAVKNLVRKANENSKKSGITGTPSFMIKGKYMVTPSTAGSSDKVFDIIDYLLRMQS